MITDRERWQVGKKKNVAGARFTNQSGPDNRTNPLREPLRLRFDDCQSEDCNQSVAQARAYVARSPGLSAAAKVQCSNAAAQIFKTNICETCRSHH